MKKRFLPVLLVMFIIAAMIPTFALADSSEMSGTEFLALEKNGVINMTGNVTLTSSAVIRGDLIIRLNGYTLSRDTSNSNSLGVLLLDISSGSVTIVGPGTITGGEYRKIRYFMMPKGVVAVAGSASLTIKDGAVISGGKIESNSTIGDFNTINFSGSGTLTIENSTVTGLNYADREAGTAVYVSGEAKVVVTDSTLTGGSSTSNAAGNALELRTSGEAAVITNSTLTGGASSQSRSGGDGLYISSDVSAVVNGGALTGGQGNSGGKGVNVSGNVTLTGVTVTGGASTNSTPGVGVCCTSTAKNVIITGSTVTGGSPAEGTTTNSAGRGMAIYGPVTLTVESSTIQGGNNNRTSGDPIGGNAILFYNENSKGANITLTDTTLGVGNEPAGDAAITGNSNAPAGSGGLPANITAGGTLTVDSGVMKNTTITPADDGLVIVAENDAAVEVGENNLTVASKGTVESEGQTTYYPTATLAVSNAKPGSTVTIQELGEGESLESVPNGIILKNGTGETITVGGQEVEPDGVLADWVAKIGNEQYVSLEAAIDAANKTAAGSVVVVEIIKSGNYDMFTITRANVTIRAPEDVTATFTVSETNTGNVNGENVTLEGLNFVSTDGTTIFSSGNCDGLTLNGCTFTGSGTGTALYIHKPNITITGCTFKDFGIAVYSQPGTAATSNIKVTGSTITDCGIAICSYAKSNVFTGNTVTGSDELSFAGGADAVTTVTGNAFTDAGKIWFYGADLGNVTFEKNKVLGDTYVTTVEAEDGTTLNVDRNYWGGSAPSETQVVGENVTGKDVYYVVPEMNESDLNTYAPYTVVLVYGNGMSNGVKNYKPNEQFILPAPSKVGYIFMGWKCSDGHTYQAYETVTVEKDMTFTAVWSALPDIEPGQPSQPDEPDVPDFPFTDVSVNAWYYEAVKYVYENGIMNGMDRYSFQPNGTLTRAMIWTMLARLDGVDTEGGNSWYAKAQEWATATGVSDGENPTGEVTREQLITMLWRYAGSPTYTADLSGYVDTADISSWAEQAMCWAVATGVIEGDENAALTPKADTTRAQAAAMLMRFIEL
jgi:uncharacterized repeat protein (TIGR02543 family)